MSGGMVDFSAHGRCIEWSVATRAKVDGFNGDGYLLNRDERRLFAYVVDGIGSGREAQAAAAATVDELRGNDFSSMEQRFNAVHQSLKGRRGAALGAAEIDLTSGALNWSAVGDIDGLIIRRDTSTESMVQKGGTLGLGFSGLHVMSTGVGLGDMIVMTSDGVSRRFRDDLPQTRDVHVFASSVLEAYGRPNDDCIVLAMKVSD